VLRLLCRADTADESNHTGLTNAPLLLATDPRFLLSINAVQLSHLSSPPARVKKTFTFIFTLFPLAICLSSSCNVSAISVLVFPIMHGVAWARE